MIIKFVCICFNIVAIGVIIGRKIRFIKITFLALCEWIKCIKESWLSENGWKKDLIEKWLAQSKWIKNIKEKCKEKWLDLCEKYDERDTEKKENKKNRIPLFFTAQSFEVKNNSLLDPETLLNLCIILIVYCVISIFLIYSIKELRSPLWSLYTIAEKAVLFLGILFYAWLFDYLLGTFIIWLNKIRKWYKEKCEEYDKKNTGEKENKKIRMPLFLTARSLDVKSLKNNSLLGPELIANISFVLIVYIFLFGLLILFIMDLRSSSGIISNKGGITVSVFLFFAVIFDSIMSFILWMIKTVFKAAERCYVNRKNDYYTFIEVFLLLWLTVFNFGIHDNLSDRETMIILVQTMILWFFVFIDQCYYIQKLTISLITDEHSYTKVEAISECLLIYITNFIILMLIVFILVGCDHLFVKSDQLENIIGLCKTKRIDGTTLFTCFRFCALTFIGMGASEFDSRSVSYSVITLVIRLIGLLTSGFIVVEILHHVVSEKNREK